MEDAQGKKRASHSICSTLKPDGSREYRIDGRVKSRKEVKVQLQHTADHEGTSPTDGPSGVIIVAMRS